MTDFPLGALILPEPAAAQAWHGWRAALDIDALSYESQQLLPALAGRWSPWLEGDVCAARFRGIAKMAWSRNQLRLHRAAELSHALRGLVEPAVMAGPLAWSLRTREPGAIRFIPNLTLLISRQHVSKGVSALARNGWQLCGELPDSGALDWSCNVRLIKGEDALHLHWRLFPAPPGEALACERATLERTGTAVWNQHAFQTLSPEGDLLHRLSGRPHWDPVPWQADVLMMPFDGVDWGRFRALALAFAPSFEPADPLGRLLELRSDWQLRIPEIAPAEIAPERLAPARCYPASGVRFMQRLGRLLGRGRLLWKS